MAGITISVESAKNNALYGDLQGPMAVLLESEYSRYENNPQFTQWQHIFPEFKLTTNSANIGEMTSIGLFEDVGENGQYPQSEMGAGYFKSVSALEWKNSFAISQSMMEDKLDFIMQDNAKTLMGSYWRTKNAFFWGLIKAALKNQDFVTAKNRKVSVKAKDGVNVFAAAHPMKNAKGNQANAFTDAFSKSALGKVATRMQNMKDDNGEILGIIPDTIIIPNSEKAKDEVFSVVGSLKDPGSANNNYNYQFGNWTVITVPWLADLASDEGYPWIVMSSQYNQDNYGARDVERIGLNVKSEIAANDANEWKGRARFGGAFVDFRAFAAGGVTFGTTA